MPTDAPPVQFPSVQGSVSIDSTAGRVHAELGPTGQLIVQWPEKSTRGENEADLTVEERALMDYAVKLTALTQEVRFVPLLRFAERLG